MKKNLIALIATLLISLPSVLGYESKLMTDPDLNNKLNSIQKINGSNCYGTMEYILGVQEEDQWTHGIKIERLLRGYKEIGKPVEGTLAIWRDRRNLDHVALVTNVVPLLIIHRQKTDGLFEKHVPISNATQLYGKDVSFYIRKH